jgi:hypothetical protein
MQKLMMVGSAAVVLMTSGLVGAQSKTIPGKTEVVTATVEAINTGEREVTVKKADGDHEVFYVPADVKRFDSLKVGDTITAKYYENIVLRMKPAGEKDVNDDSRGAVPGAAGTAGTASHQRTITATITAIDPAVPSITFSGPNGWKYSTRVQDKEALAKVKVGDKVDITWTEAMVVSLEPGK